MHLSEDQTQTMTAAGLNLIAQALSIYDSDLRLVVCNRPFQQMFDLPQTFVTPGAEFSQTIRHLATTGEYGPVDDIEALVQERCEQARAFQPHYVERTRANGRTISIEGSPLPEGGWVTVYTDITVTKKQEAMLRARSDALSDQVLAHSEELAATNRKLAAMVTTLEETKHQLTLAEARTRLTTEMMPAHIAHLDNEGRYTFSNRRLSSVLPGRAREIVGQHISTALGEDAFTQVSPALTQAFEGKPAVLEFTDAASSRRIRVSFTPDTQGGAYVLSMDVTEETQARVALQQTLKRQSAAQLISGLAHDFSNLLTIILGMQSRLARAPDLNPDARTLVEGTLAAARRGGTLLSSIADMTNPRALSPTATNPAALMADLHTLAAPSLPKGMRLHVHNTLPATPLMLDKGKITDGLLNLILNARDACGDRGDITVGCNLVHDTWIEWQVGDTGPGFTPTALTRGIDPFFTTKGSEGSGLGLSMVYDMIKSAGGDLRLANSAAGGAVVTLRLPYRAAFAGHNGMVLLVEDDADLRAVVRGMLTDLGHTVIETSSADEARALIADLPDISLVISDLQLKGTATGVDLARSLARSTPLILMTSLPPDHALFIAAQQHAPVLRKPFTKTALGALISPQPEVAE